MRDNIFAYILTHDLCNSLACLSNDVVAVADKIALKGERKIFPCLGMFHRERYNMFLPQKIFG